MHTTFPFTYTIERKYMTKQLDAKEILDRITNAFKQYSTLVDPLMEIRTRNSATISKHEKYKAMMERCLYYVAYSITGDDEKDMQDMLDELDNLNEEIRQDIRLAHFDNIAKSIQKAPRSNHLKLVK